MSIKVAWQGLLLKCNQSGGCVLVDTVAVQALMICPAVCRFFSYGLEKNFRPDVYEEFEKRTLQVMHQHTALCSTLPFNALCSVLFIANGRPPPSMPRWSSAIDALLMTVSICTFFAFVISQNARWQPGATSTILSVCLRCCMGSLYLPDTCQ